jgi:hypothetical protein
MRPKNKVNFKWSPYSAYVIGLLATDGCLSKDGSHVDFTSKDLELVELLKKYLSLGNKIGKKVRGGEKEKKYFRIQFGDVIFYKFLMEIGLCSAKSKVLGSLKIEDKYFFDFLRGCVDGDGNIHTFLHPESKNPQLRLRIASASKDFLNWIKNKNSSYNVKGWITKTTRAYTLVYAMKDSIYLLNRVYYKDFPPSLDRKFHIAQQYLRT